MEQDLLLMETAMKCRGEPAGVVPGLACVALGALVRICEDSYVPASIDTRASQTKVKSSYPTVSRISSVSRRRYNKPELLVEVLAQVGKLGLATHSCRLSARAAGPFVCGRIDHVNI
jgi:hypothetical protein